MLLPARRTLTAAAVVALAAATLSACGEASDKEPKLAGEDAKVAKVVTDLFEASRDEEPARICRALLVKKLATADCSKLVQQAIDDSDTLELEVKKVAITGDRATAQVQAGLRDARRTTTVRLVREAGAWKISAFA